MSSTRTNKSNAQLHTMQKAKIKLAALRIGQGRAIYSAFPGTFAAVTEELPMLGLNPHRVHTRALSVS